MRRKSKDGQAISSPTVGAGAESEENNFIAIDDFLKVELRVGEVKVADGSRTPTNSSVSRSTSAKKNPARSLLACRILRPRKTHRPQGRRRRQPKTPQNARLESQGMICAASLTEEDSPAIATFLEDVKVGARLK
jgi:hypothetical protein